MGINFDKTTGEIVFNKSYRCFIEYYNGKWIVYKNKEDKYKKIFSLLDFPGYLKHIINLLTYEWKPTDQSRKYDYQKYIKKQIGGLVNHIIYPNWQEVIESLDNDYITTYKKFFSANFNRKPILSYETYHDLDNYFISDINKYPAAGKYLYNQISGRNIFDMNTNKGCIKSINPDWRSYYSYSNKPYKFLNLTLDKVSNNYPDLLTNLSRIELERPALSKVELIASVHNRNNRVVKKSRHKEVLSSIKIHNNDNEYRYQNYSSRKTGDILEFFDWCTDFPEPFNGKIEGLCKRSIRYHRDLANNRVNNSINTCSLPHDTPSLSPPIDLPPQEGVEFLTTVGNIISEGSRMGHCVSSYASAAVEGRIFLFHVDYKGESATVEVSHDGIVLQSRGPKNRMNEASKYGTKILKKWGKKLKNNTYPQQARLQAIQAPPF